MFGEDFCLTDCYPHHGTQSMLLSSQSRLQPGHLHFHSTLMGRLHWVDFLWALRVRAFSSPPLTCSWAPGEWQQRFQAQRLHVQTKGGWSLGSKEKQLENETDLFESEACPYMKQNLCTGASVLWDNLSSLAETLLLVSWQERPPLLTLEMNPKYTDSYGCSQRKAQLNLANPHHIIFYFLFHHLIMPLSVPHWILSRRNCAYILNILQKY